jgi:hypothetical protein
MFTSRKQTESVQSRVIKALDAEPDYQQRIFSAFEDDLIRKYYPAKGASAIAKHINKKPRQIMERACALGVRRQ